MCVFSRFPCRWIFSGHSFRVQYRQKLVKHPKAMCPTELTVDGSSVVSASWIFNGPYSQGLEPCHWRVNGDFCGASEHLCVFSRVHCRWIFSGHRSRVQRTSNRDLRTCGGLHACCRSAASPAVRDAASPSALLPIVFLRFSLLFGWLHWQRGCNASAIRFLR